MKSTRMIRLGLTACLLLPLVRAEAQVTGYFDEAAFLAALTAQNFPVTHEGFEDDLAWGAYRSSIVGGAMTAPSISNLGITWTGNNSISEVTTGSGAALTGNWGFYQIPHGDVANSMPDGVIGTGDTSLVAIGGWMDTNTPNAGIALFLDGVEVGFTGSTALGAPARFFGAIAPAGFLQFEFRETEAAPGDWKFIFSDDFYFAFGGSVIDCNANGIGDSLDISSGASTDCNLNFVPDECEIDVNSTAPGGPFYCQSGCETDCDNNGILDACELVQPIVFPSGQLGPIGNLSPQAFSILPPAMVVGDVLLDFSAYANLGGPDEYLDIELNNTPVGTVFVNDGADCPDPLPSETRLAIPHQTFINLVGSGTATFDIFASLEVDANDCDLPSTLEVDVTIFVPSVLDLNTNGVLDSCESVAFASLCNGDGGDQAGCTDCPCSNNAPIGTIGGCLNSAASSAELSASGDPSVSLPTGATTDLRFELHGAPPTAFCILNSGDAVAPAGMANPCFGLDSGAQSLSFDGLRCAVMNTRRHGGRSADANGDVGVTGSPWGGEGGPPVGLAIAFGGFSAGQTRYFQGINRDDPLLSCMRALNTSQAVKVTFTP